MAEDLQLLQNLEYCIEKRKRFTNRYFYCSFRARHRKPTDADEQLTTATLWKSVHKPGVSAASFSTRKCSTEAHSNRIS